MELITWKNDGKRPCETCPHKKGDPECQDCIHGDIKCKGEPAFRCKSDRCPYHDGTGCMGGFENSCVAARKRRKTDYDPRCPSKFGQVCDVCPSNGYKKCKNCILSLENVGTNKFHCRNKKCQFNRGGRTPTCMAWCENVCGAAIAPAK